MPRPKTKGEPLVLRLPLSLDDALDRYCEARGTSRILGAETILELHLADFQRSQSLFPVEEPAATCSHDESYPIAGGLRRCQACSKIRGADGQWRDL
jgi:hypothetical protein